MALKPTGKAKPKAKGTSGASKRVRVEFFYAIQNPKVTNRGAPVKNEFSPRRIVGAAVIVGLLAIGWFAEKPSSERPSSLKPATSQAEEDLQWQAKTVSSYPGQPQDVVIHPSQIRGPSNDGAI